MPRRSMVSLLALTASFAVSDAVVVDARPPTLRAEIEANDTLATATPFQIIGGYGIGTGAISAPGDVDYWSFLATSSVTLSILCDTGGTQAAGATSRRVTLELIGLDGATLEIDRGDGTGNGGDGTVETMDAAAIGPRFTVGAGIHHIRISADSPNDVVNPYRLFVGMAGVLQGWHGLSYGRADASPIAGPGIGAIRGTLQYTSNWYSVQAAAGDVLFFAASSTELDLVVELLAPDGETLLLRLSAAPRGSLAEAAAESGSFSISTAGRYFLRVGGPFCCAYSGQYLLMVAVRSLIDTLSDFDGDARTDAAVYTGQGFWMILRSTDLRGDLVSWGEPLRDDIPVPADYDGDGHANLAVYRNTTGQWIVRAADGGSTVIDWGAPWLGDIPIPGDYDGDRLYDAAVYRKATGHWFIRLSAGGSAWFQWGAPWLDDIAVPADYDGDAVTDVAVFRRATGEWFIAYSGGGAAIVEWGAPWLGDIPVPADYDGDGRAEVAVYRASTGEWFLRYAGGSAVWAAWGTPSSNEIPVPGDYDGDGVTDLAVYRPDTGVFVVRMRSVLGGLLLTPALGPNHVPVNRPVAVR